MKMGLDQSKVPSQKLLRRGRGGVNPRVMTQQTSD